MKNLQLEINFERRPNRLRQALEGGDFVLLIESASPGRDNDPAASAERLAKLEQSILEIEGLHTGLAITDRAHALDVWRAAEYASALSPENRDRHLVYLSGRDTPAEEVRNLAKIAGNAGNLNLIPVSGSVVPGDALRDTRRRSFTESVTTLRMLKNDWKDDVYAGATVNPYAYAPHTLMGQYFKLVKKFRAGASFLVAQAGWDMLKLQSLAWYLFGRSLFYPMVARLILLTPDKVERILAGEYPGVGISQDFRKILEQELRYSETQFEAAQYRRLELQAAGCRLMGFSGIQLAGAEQPARAKIAARRIAQAIGQYTTFEYWLEDYNANLARTEMAPSSRSFYLYDRTLRRNYPGEGAAPAANEFDEPAMSAMERLGYRARDFFFSHADRQAAGNGRLLKLLLAKCHSCGSCRLPQCFQVCPEGCPKRLANGPCGGVRADGSCEAQPGVECVHIRITRYAHWRDQIQLLEEQLLDQGR